MKRLFLLYGIVGFVLLIYSYLFVDTNLWLLSDPLYKQVQQSFKSFLLGNRAFVGSAYVVIILGLTFGYWAVLKGVADRRFSVPDIKKLFLFISVFLLCSFPGFSYDVFNYIATARVTYYWNENPWVTMPIDIANEPALAYTRAANKVALYGPTWIGLTFLPHVLANGNPWVSIFTFKFLTFLFLLLFLLLLYRYTKNLWQTVFFAFNPLVLMELVLGGHNDIVMMFLATSSLVLYVSRPKLRIVSFVLLSLSILVKGATLVLVPLLFVTKPLRDRVFLYGTVGMFAVFLLTPFREEMYPWYAVWWLSFLVLNPYKKYRFIYSAAAFFSFGLLLRHAPYIFMGYYEGPGPILRILLTILPAILFVIVERKEIIRLVMKVRNFRETHKGVSSFFG